MVSSANAPAGLQLLGELPGGGMARVWRARLPDGTLVALKRLRPELCGDAELRTMFADEGRLGARLHHPAIVPLLSHGEDAEGPFLAFAYVDGADLREVLSARGSPLPPEVVHGLARALLGALDYAHTLTDGDGRPLGVIHRDISPANVLLSRQGEVRLADFGVAASELKTHRTRTGDLKGKCAYMSPEQSRGEPLDARSDLFSLGVLLWEAATCRPLFDRPTDVDTLLAVREFPVPPLDAAVPEAVRNLVEQLLRRGPGERPASAGEALRALDAALAPMREEEAAAHVRNLVSLHAPPRGEAAAPRRRRTQAGRAAVVVPPPVETLAAPVPRRSRAAWGWVPALLGLAGALAWWSLPGETPAHPPVAPVVPVAEPLPPAAPPPAPEPVKPAKTVVRPPVRVLPAKPAEPPAVEAPRAYGLLDLNSEPWAEVSIDGTPLGLSTPARGVRVPAGSRRVTFRNPVFKLEKTVTVEVVEGGRKPVVVDLE